MKGIAQDASVNYSKHCVTVCFYRIYKNQFIINSENRYSSTKQFPLQLY